MKWEERGLSALVCVFVCLCVCVCVSECVYYVYVSDRRKQELGSENGWQEPRRGSQKAKLSSGRFRIRDWVRNKVLMLKAG
jgi:hypothetical protein